MKKQEYMKPQIEVVKIQQSGIICSSPAVRGLSLPGKEGLTMPDDYTLEDDDEDV